jgi:amino acid adenylation domain-containing protein
MPHSQQPPASAAALTPARRALLEKWRQGRSSPGPEPRRADGPVPLSFQQQRLWFLQQLQPGEATYTMVSELRLNGTLHIQALEQSLTLLVARHEPLRTCFPARQGQPVQQIQAPAPVRLALLELSLLAEEPRRATVGALLTDLVGRPMALATGPLLRLCLLRLAPRRHVLALCMHHALYDGHSLAIFLRELVQAYHAHLTQAPPALPALPLTYADYAHWQRTQLSGRHLDALVAYWQAQLLDAPTFVPLPTDRPRPPQQTHHGARLRLPMQARLAGELHTWSRQEGVTPFMVALAAFSLLLARYSGQRDLLVGTPVANRPHPAFETLIGFFANLLVLRARTVGNPTFRAFVQQIRAVALAAYAHQELPFEQLVEALQPPRSLSHNPLVQVVFALDQPALSCQAPGLQVDWVLAESGLAHFDLLVSLLPGAGDAHCAVEAQYNSDLFERASIQRLLGHYLHLLAAGLRQPERHIDELPLLSESAQAQALARWQQPPVLLPQAGGIHELIEQQARRTPDALAVVLEDSALTYQELNRRAENLATFLQTLGVGPERVVGLCLARCIESIIGLLAILKAGGAYLPLDPTYPAERLAYLLADSQVALVLTRDGQAPVPGLQAARLLRLDDCPPGLPAISRPRVQPANLAYVIYTSGSTGQPAGVALPHRGLCNLVGALGLTCALAPGARVLQFASLNFDASVLEIFGALTHGACLVLACGQDLLPGPPLLATLLRQAISLTLLPPSTLAALDAGATLPALRTLIAGGEACPASLAAAWAGGRAFFNAYGPTEVTVCATMARCQDGSQEPPLGSPLANVQLYLLDAALQPVPPGVCGEIYLGGPGLARGYLGRPETTARRFLPHPFSTQQGLRLYRTGDLARYEHGTLTFVGRADFQLKVRGFRIEPGEIEAALRTLPAVQDAVVLAHRLRAGAPVLVACVAIPGSPGGLDALALRQHLRTRLPEYLLPAHIVLLPTLPTTPQGKYDRRALRELVAGSIARERQGYRAPQGSLQQTISATWQEVLQVARIGRDENFFDLGGHSLALTRVHALLQERLRREIALLDLFHYPTVETLAHFLQAGAPAPRLHESQARARRRRASGAAPAQESERAPYA